MELKTIEEAKKYIGKIIYTASDFSNRGRYKVIPLFIGGVYLHYNQVNYTVESFTVWEDDKYKNYYGNIEKNLIGSNFDAKKQNQEMYFYSKEEAEKYREWLQRDENDRDKEYDIETAKKLLEKHKIKFEIFN